MVIFLDFDGTVVEHAYPKMGRENFGCFEVLEKLQKAGHSFILNTYRADIDPKELKKAVYFIEYHPRHEIKLSDVAKKKVNPPAWDIERAVIEGLLFIDDQSNGTPLKPCVMQQGKMVDWDALDKIFQENGMY